MSLQDSVAAASPKRPSLLCFVFTVLLALSVQALKAETRSSDAGDQAWRPPTDSEIRTLFELAVRNRPARFFAAAEIVKTKSPRNPQVIDEAIQLLAKARDKTAYPSKATVRSLSAENAFLYNATKYIERISEWYAGPDLRTDQFPSNRSTPSDRAFSEYYKSPIITLIDFGPGLNGGVSSVAIQNSIRSINITKGPSLRRESEELWAIVGMEEPLVVPLLHALSNLSSVEIDELVRSRLYGISRAEISTEKVSRVPSLGWDWLVVCSQEGSNIRYRLQGAMPGRKDREASKVVCEYVIETLVGRPRLLYGSFANLSTGIEYSSTRDRFGDDGLPRMITRNVSRNGSFTKSEILFNEVDLTGKFDDSSLFNVPTTQTHPTFIINHIIGQGGVVQNVSYPAGVGMPGANEVGRKRKIVVTVALLFTSTIALVLFWGSKRPA